jgi:transposase
MLVALETGTHSPWASRAVTNAGHEVIVANVRPLQLINGAKHKSDVRDGEKLARVRASTCGCWRRCSTALASSSGP